MGIDLYKYDAEQIRRGEEAQIVRSFVMNHLPYMTLAIDYAKAAVLEDYTVLILGVNPISIELLKQIVTMGQFDGRKFSAILLDEEVKLTKSDQRLLNQLQVKVYEMRFDTKEFMQFLRNESQSLKQIIICREDPQSNQELLLRIESLFQQICAQSLGSFANLYRPKIAKVFPNESLYDTKSQTNPSVLIELLAIEIYEYYHKYCESLVPWDRLEEFEKEANRSPAMHLFTKLALVGLKVVPEEEVGLSQPIGSWSEYMDYIGPMRLEQLSKLEHMRWCAFYRVNGWTQLIPDEVDPRVKDEALHQHACLVGWDELPEISKRFGGDYQKKDRDGVIHIFDFLKNLNYSIVRMK